MMMAKIMCVLGPALLGYNVLFQDVDIVWYRDPLSGYLQNDDISPEHSAMIREFDVFFQDDGAHTVRYAPYSANSGFYFVKSNPRTLAFLADTLSKASLVLRTESHQQALIGVLNEHSSVFGLRVKVLNRELDEFPGGFHYHKQKQFMKDVFAGKKHPILFHMSWTNDKTDKIKFMKQSNMWFVQDQCIEPSGIQEMLKSRSTDAQSLDLSSQCCSAKPLFSCHWRDKPSAKPCKDSPAIDNGKLPSFW
jgi:Nucleotide-diphospho-sugar transferase